MAPPSATVLSVRAARISLLILVVASVGAGSCGGGGASPTRTATDSAAAPATAAGADAASARHGTLVGADTLANTRIGGPYGTVLAYRFRSQWTGVVRSVRVYVVVNSDGRDGYSGGTGGRLRVSLGADAGRPRHVPSGRRLASATVATPSRDSWPLVRFAKPPKVVAGRYYHVVFTNDDPDPRENYVSVNALLSYGHGEPAPRVPDGLAVLLAGTRDGGATPNHWETRAELPGQRYAPILDVAGGRPGQHLGLGYMEVWSSNPKPIGGESEVRQLLGRGPSRAITGAWLRVRRRDGASAPLVLSIGRVAGGVLAKASVPASSIPADGDRWVHVRFAHPVRAPGEKLVLTAAADAPSSYGAFPIRNGIEFGFDPRAVFDAGYAQFTRGGAWTGWDQWGQPNRRDGALQFALDLAG
jgi:hypothetical protein